MKWPEAPTDYPIGDDLYAHACHRPESVDELRDAVTRCAAVQDGIYPQGGRTCLDHGGTPERPGSAIDVTGLRSVVDYPAADMTITVEAGMTLASLQAVLGRENQWLTLDAPLSERATLGGIFSTGTCGPRRLGHGRPRDQIIGVAFVTSEGTVVRGGGRVVKNVAGYDFPKLLTGSLGTLGILTEMTFRVRPRPEGCGFVIARFTDLGCVDTALSTLNTSATRPAAMELLNTGGTRGLAGLGLPEPSSGEWMLLLGYEGNAEAVIWQLGRVKDELATAEPAEIHESHADALWTRLADLPETLRGRLSLKASLPPSAVCAFCELLPAGRWSVHAHAGSGVVWAHLEAGSELLTDLLPEVDQLRGFADTRGGSLTAPICPPAWKERLRVWGEPRPDWKLMGALQKALDPGRLMNPGRFEAMM